MPQMTFAPENKSQDPTAFPKVYLDKDGRARIACLENPEYGFRHRLAAPKIINDKPQYEETDRGGTVMVMDFIGNPMCLGDVGILRDKGNDPAHCPACRKAKESDRIGPAQRRFAMHVVEYGLQPGGFIVQNPFSIMVKVWAYADSTFNKLSDFMQEWGPLSKHDLNLGPCTNKGFQKFDIAISAQAVWLVGGGGLTAKETQQMTAKAFRNNRCIDLSAFLGRKVPESFMLEDIARVENRWRLVDKHTSGQTGATTEDHEAALQEGLEDLLDHNPATGSPAPAGSDLDVDSLLNSMVEQEAARTEPAREQVVITPPTAQDLAEIEQMKEQVAESSAAAQAAEVVPAAPTKAAVQEVSVADILGDTADPTPAPAAATPVTAASTPAATPASTAPGSTPPSEPAEDLDFEKFLAEYSGE